MLISGHKEPAMGEVLKDIVEEKHGIFKTRKNRLIVLVL